MASREDEDVWLSGARDRTVREMRLLVKERSATNAQMSAVAVPVVGPDDEKATLTLTMDREDAWLFECARMLVSQVAGGPLEQTVEALLGEGVTSLPPRVDREVISLLAASSGFSASHPWRPVRHAELQPYDQGRPNPDG